ncbi:MAG TPA: hypothetical protein VGO74_09965 [Modestobacter sp.]|jgi:hypothetical protein|nr:hypothetical protein [Modestobacter sp.]
MLPDAPGYLAAALGGALAVAAGLLLGRSPVGPAVPAGPEKRQ